MGNKFFLHQIKCTSGTVLLAETWDGTIVPNIGE